MIKLEIYEILGKILAAFFVACVVYLSPKFKEWLKINTDKDTLESILKLVNSFAQAAEQLLHDEDPTGEKRQEYVQKRLEESGVVITDEIISMIEGAVWSINNQNKKANVGGDIK